MDMSTGSAASASACPWTPWWFLAVSWPLLSPYTCTDNSISAFKLRSSQSLHYRATTNSTPGRAFAQPPAQLVYEMPHYCEVCNARTGTSSLHSARTEYSLIITPIAIKGFVRIIMFASVAVVTYHLIQDLITLYHSDYSI
jgi:hypothetical protein